MKTVVCLSLTLLLLVVFVPDAFSNRQNPGSCILFPYYDTSGATMSIHTVTNVGTQSVAVRIVFVNGVTCEPVSTKHTLTAGDTFTFAAHGFVSQPQTGFVYVYVLDSFFDVLEKKADVLIGQEIVVGYWNSLLVNFSMNAVNFQALNVVKDGKLHLDGTEYTCAPKTLYFPRFFGQQGLNFFSKLIVLNLTGGRWFGVNIHLWAYNDNEQPYDMWFETNCFEVFYLGDMAPFFDMVFLRKSNHDPYEPWPFHSFAETGTMKMTGDFAQSKLTGKIIDDPGIYAVLVEGVGTLGFTAADLPMQVEDPAVFNHAVLWSTDPNGN
jgi:hypothetical protein